MKLALPSGLSRPTIRQRLTLLYGALFVVSGAVLLVITFVVVLAVGSFAHTAPVGVGTPPADVGNSLQAQLAAQSATQRQAMLIGSVIALGVMALVSMALGWMVAGRILSPLRTITATARRISATSLNQRLAMDGPNDEIKELGDTFDALLARLEASFQSQRRFIANVSHELRTPLARQRVLAQVALADPEATLESLRVAHQRVLASGVEEETLIDALLALAQGQAGRSRNEAFDLALIAGQVLHVRQPEIERRTLEVDIALAAATAKGDPLLVERLAANLIDNAIRHNRVNGRVRVITQTRDGQAVLSVVNTGPVVPATAVEVLFQPFQRLGPERTGHRDGSGLGLSIVRAIADAHDATVRINPQPEGGLEVEVAFPVNDAN